MKIFAISDLHLSGCPPTKPMDIFGSKWIGHWDKICSFWNQNVTDSDFILLPGDISWAMKLEEALIDLAEISKLPGHKIICRGNHDYWWQTITKMTRMVDSRIIFLQNNFVQTESYAICGSRGWICPSDPLFSSDDQHIYNNEVNRIKLSLEAAINAGFAKIILMLHYLPICSTRKANGITELIGQYNVETCIYGHLHGPQAHSAAPQGTINGTTYHLVACDALNFKLHRIV